MSYEEARALCIEFVNKFDLEMTEGYGKGDDKIIEITCNEAAAQSEEFIVLSHELMNGAINIWKDYAEHRGGYVYDHFVIAFYNI